jgi:hypothetical protein
VSTRVPWPMWWHEPDRCLAPSLCSLRLSCSRCHQIWRMQELLYAVPW